MPAPARRRPCARSARTGRWRCHWIAGRISIHRKGLAMMFPAKLPARRPPTVRPRATRLRVERLEDRTVPSANVFEVEPNNTTTAANAVPLGFDAGEDTRVVVNGDIATLGDRDWFLVRLNAGDVIGGAVRARSGLDPTVRLVNSAGALLWFLDNHDSLGEEHPPESPL